MSVTVVTSMSAALYRRYGREFLESYWRYAPTSWRLRVYTEDPKVLGRVTMDAHPLPLTFDAFVRAAPSWANGREPRPGWREKHLKAGYNYRTDAIRFAAKAYALIQGYYSTTTVDQSCPLIVWLDADTVLTQPIAPDWPRRLLRDGVVARLHRPRSYTETGCLILKRSLRCNELMLRYEWLYSSGELFKLPEQHDAYVFDQALRVLEPGEITNLATGSGDIFASSPLSVFLTHYKGDLKNRLAPARGD